MNDEIKSEEKIVPNYALDIINTNHALEKKRLWILVFVLVALLFGTNTGWIIYENQFEDTVTVTNDVQTSDDAPAYVSGTGGITVNGESKANSNKNP